MADSASEIDLESDTSSVDGLSMKDMPGKCDQLQRRLDLVQQENRVLKTEVETLKLRIRSLTDTNHQLRKNSVNIQAKAEQEEEFISNMLQRRISELKKEKESLAISYEQEEECLTNELNRKLVQLRQDKELLEQTLAKEQETQVNKLKRRIEKLECEKNTKQQSLDQLRREKIELENALEQEQEALVNRLWKKMDKLEAEKRLLQEKLETASAPLSGSSSVQNLQQSMTDDRHHSVRLLSIVDQHTSQPNLKQSTENDSVILPKNSSALSATSLGQHHVKGHQLDANTNSSECGIPRLPTNRPSTAVTCSPKPPQSPMDCDNQDGQPIRPISATDIEPFPTNMPKSNNPIKHFNRTYLNNPLTTLLDASESNIHSIMDSRNGATHVAMLRAEVIRLRALVSSNLSEHASRMRGFDREERMVAEENHRLKQRLQMESEFKEALSRQLSGSESSLEMEDERHFNEASRSLVPTNRFRTTSDGCPSPCYSSVSAYLGTAGDCIYGPGYAYASAVAAASSSGRLVSTRHCRECGQSIPPKINQSNLSNLLTSQRSSHDIDAGQHVTSTPSFPSTPQASILPSVVGLDLDGRFVKPSNRAPSLSTALHTHAYRSGEKNNPPMYVSTKESSEEDDDERCLTPPISSCQPASTLP